MSTDGKTETTESAKLPEGFDKWLLHFKEVAQNAPAPETGLTDEEIREMDQSWEDEEQAESAYPQALEAANQRLAALGGKDGIDKHREKVTAAINLAKTHAEASNPDFPKAVQLLSSTVQLQAAALQAATDCGTYKTELQKAKDRITGLTGKVAVTEQLKDIQGKYDEATEAAKEEDYGTALNKVAESLSLHGNAEEIVNAYEDWVAHYAMVKGRVDGLRTHPGRKGQVDVWFQEIDGHFNQAEKHHAKKEYIDAKTKLVKAFFHKRPEAEDLAAARDWYEKSLPAVDDRIDELDLHAGKKCNR